LPTLPRQDPPSRPVDGDLDLHVENKEPDRWYILANPNDTYCGVQRMLAMGYRVETRRKDGPRLVGGNFATEGEAVTFNGDILMSCPLAEHIARWKKGQAMARLFDQRSVSPGGIDGLSGPTGKAAIHGESAEFALKGGDDVPEFQAHQ
jgi:hypothetical protein